MYYVYIHVHSVQNNLLKSYRTISLYKGQTDRSQLMVSMETINWDPSV